MDARFSPWRGDWITGSAFGAETEYQVLPLWINLERRYSYRKETGSQVFPLERRFDRRFSPWRGDLIAGSPMGRSLDHRFSPWVEGVWTASFPLGQKTG